MIVCAMVLLPLTANAYLSPEQVFGGGGTTTTTASSSTGTVSSNTPMPFVPGASSSSSSSSSFSYVAPSQTGPVTRTNADEQVQWQQDLAARNRAHDQQNIYTTLPSSSSSADMHAAAPVTQGTSSSCGDRFSDECIYQQRMDRLQADKGDQPVIIVNGNGQVTDSYGHVLHSGAPLVAATGPADILAVIVLLIAAVITLAPVFRSKKKSIFSMLS